MIRKSARFNWCMFNTIIIMLLAGSFLTYEKWSKPEAHFWFVSYEWVKSKERGAGRTCIENKESDFDILAAENTIKTKNKFETLIINNFIPIPQKTYELCIKQPQN